MQTILQQKALRVKKSPIHGYGVFAGLDFFPNDVIEECHLIITSNYDDNFSNYYFSVDEERGAILFGNGCIYNHSTEPNANYFFDRDKELMIFYATRFIPKGEEILVSYGKEWFAKRHILLNEPSLKGKVWRFLKGIPFRGLIVLGVFFSLLQLARLWSG